MQNGIEKLCKIAEVLTSDEMNLESTTPERIAEIKAEEEKCREQQEKEQALSAAKQEAERHELIDTFNAWCKTHKARIEDNACPSAYQLMSQDFAILYRYLTTGYICDTAFDVISAVYRYGFRRGNNYINNQIKKAKKAV